MKKSFFLTALVAVSLHALGQAKDGTEEFNRPKPIEPAVMISLPYAPSVVQKVVEYFLQNPNTKSKDGGPVAANTAFMKNYKELTNINLQIREKDPSHPNETIVFLKLNASSLDENGKEKARLLLDKQLAIDFLDSMAIAIKPYATELQYAHLKRELARTQQKSETVAKRESRLEKQRSHLDQKLSTNNNTETTGKLSKRQLRKQQQLEATLNMQEQKARTLDNQKLILASLIIGIRQ